ncbi:MAG TPA: histidine kinase [Puia sp.]|nr:histidine kinase [Puia sp.]
MNLFTEKTTPRQLQFLVWGVIFLINFFSYLSMDGFLQASIYTVLNTFFYALIIYGNISFLFPLLYERKKETAYVIAAIFFITSIGFIKAVTGEWVYNKWFAEKPHPLTIQDVIYVMLTSIVVFILSFIFRIAIAYFKLKQQAQQMLEQKSVAELNLLKSQVQPHFLFNTLNNIYYEAFREAPRTALLIGRLSDIMRYFVDESPKEKVSLATEIQFLENYIALEKIRVLHGVQVAFTKECECEATIPPMLLMTFVENIFKHGIDRSGTENSVLLSLTQRERTLIFQTENALQHPPPHAAKEGSGLKNLQKRLTLLYGNNFELNIVRSDQFFRAHLKIPLI